MRLERDEPVDVVILARPALGELVKQGKALPASFVDLVRSSIGMGVRAGARKPIAYSDSASGVHLSAELGAAVAHP
jgi:hypothetical protein